MEVKGRLVHCLESGGCAAVLLAFDAVGRAVFRALLLAMDALSGKGWCSVGCGGGGVVSQASAVRS